MPAAGFGHVAIPRFAEQVFPADDKSTVRRPIGPGVVPTTNRVPIALARMPAPPAGNEVGVGDYSPSGYLLPTPLPTRDGRPFEDASRAVAHKW